MKKYVVILAVLGLAYTSGSFADSDHDADRHEQHHRGEGNLRAEACGNIRAGENVNGSNPNSNGPVPGSKNDCIDDHQVVITPRRDRHHFHMGSPSSNSTGADPAGAGR